MKILHLTLKRQWFDMIASGEKKEEYRELKEYWWKRLTTGKYCIFNEYDIIRFRNGYTQDAPTVDVEFKNIRVSVGYPDWGASPGEMYFVITLGKVLNSVLNDEPSVSTDVK